MDNAAHLASKHLERLGYHALAHPVATFNGYRNNGEKVPYYTVKPDWSQPHAAVAAGLSCGSTVSGVTTDSRVL